MPLKLNVGLSKKVGLPGYGSLGASCHVELELDGALLQSDLDRFHQHVQRAFVACRQAVQDELSRQGGTAQPDEHPANHGPHGIPQGDRRGRTSSQGRHAGNGQAPRASKQVTPKQRRYATEMAGRIDGLGLSRLDELIWRMFGKALAQLSSMEASSLIETLRDMEAGKIDPQAAFGAAA